LTILLGIGRLRFGVAGFALLALGVLFGRTVFPVLVPVAGARAPLRRLFHFDGDDDEIGTVLPVGPANSIRFDDQRPGGIAHPLGLVQRAGVDVGIVGHDARGVC